MLLALGILVAVLTYFYFYIKFSIDFNYWKKRNVEYINPSFPFGNTSKIFLGQVGLGDLFKGWYSACKGKFLGVYYMNSPALLLKDPELIKQVLIKDFNYFMDRGIYTDESKEPTSGHLFRLTGEKWRILRNKLTPAFTGGKLRMMFCTLTDVGDKLKAYLEKHQKETIDMEDVCTRFSADIIASSIFGIDVDSFKNQTNEFILMAKDLFVSESYVRIAKASLQLFLPSVVKFFNMESVKPAQNMFIFKMVQDVIQYREKNNIVRADLMQLLMQLKNQGQINADNELSCSSDSSIQKLNIFEVTAQAYTFFFAGFETASSTLNFLLYECALDHDLQSRIQDCIDVNLKKFDGSLSYESISEMDYLDRAVSETLRKYPILPFLNRVCTKDYKIPDSNVVIKKDTRVVISVSGLQHDPLHYPDPEKFDPDRFLTENLMKRHNFTYLPFGEGPRNCIGKRLGKMMVAVGAAVILKNFNVDVSEETQIPLDQNQLSFFIKPTKPIILNLSKRFQSKC